MRVLYICAECKPYAKAGGVGDVAGELPPALRAAGVEVEIVLPWYGRIDLEQSSMEFAGVSERFGFVADLRGVPVNFVKSPTYFEADYTPGVGRAVPPFPHPHLFRRDYSRVYVDSAPQVPFLDDALRFCFFAEACLRLIEQKDPDIVHVNDWVSGHLLGRMVQREMPQKTVLTVHNVGYQGNLGRDLLDGLPMFDMAADPTLGPLFEDPRPRWRSVNTLRLAMEVAGVVNTVSPNYRKEITRPEDPAKLFEGGKGLDKVAARLRRKGRLLGVLNGFEYASDPTEAGFRTLVDRKAEAKSGLVRRLGFADRDACLFGFVGRAVEQKFRLLTEKVRGRSVLEHILDIPGINVAIVATGLPEYEEFLAAIGTRPNAGVAIAFDRQLAQQVSLGSDVFLMPSLFEPCGIAQMESLSCATPPLVRWTGGLVDTVKPHTNRRSGTGFGFDGSSRSDLLANLVSTVREALRMYSEEPEAFRALQRRGYRKRFRWDDSAQEYIGKVYEPLLAGRFSGSG